MQNSSAESAQNEKVSGLASVGLAYLSAIGAAWATIVFVPIENVLYRTFVADLVATCVIFGWSVWFKNSSFYDAYWSLAPIVITLYWWIGIAADAATLRSIAVVAIVSVWGLRLTFNWARGWTGLDHEDWRYRDFQTQFPRAYWAISFGGIHLFPTLIVFAGLAAVFPAFADGGRPMNAVDLLAVLCGLAGIGFEWLADRQLNAFVRDRSASGAILRTGLWRYSRHPNYLGEMLIWWSLYLFGVAADPSWAAWAVLAPIAMTAMFLFVSIPLIEKRSLERRPGYQQVIDETSMLIPLPPRRSTQR